MVSHASEFENIAREDEMLELESLQRDRKRACPIEIKQPAAEATGKVNSFLQCTSAEREWRRSRSSRTRRTSPRTPRAFAARSSNCACAAVGRLAETLPPCPRRWTSASGRISTRCAPRGDAVSRHAAQTRGTQGDGGTPVGHVPLRLIDASTHRFVRRKVKSCVRRCRISGSRRRCNPSRSVLRVGVTLTPDFVWRDSQHGGAQRWLVWVEDPVNEHIYHTETFTLSKQHGEGPQYLYSPSPSSSRCRPNISSAPPASVARVRDVPRAQLRGAGAAR